MTTAPFRRHAARTIAAVLSPAVVWAALLLAAPFAGPGTQYPLAWGAGAALLVCAVPWAIVTGLDRRADLRRGLGRLRAGPTMVCTGVLMYGTLRVIRWWHGPLALAAVILGIFAGYAAVLLARRKWPLYWPAATLGAAAVIMPLLLGLPGLLALPLLLAGLWAAAALKRGTAARLSGSALAGAVVCGGICAVLLQAVR
ncbi:hypothetical protein LVY72_10605 [Arthrobacter sp. I2-34]|uniref:Uncharacterized protein n=1 Tax=Arthrobacter hankyongi TaxID=2904801 RepID=A0ABS9L6Q6_9MICC|nr:hypothetical protein [Arthrobacter hankyongi]MCG2622365.1 hypothetical protein [Arthrobacter hankyongi]